jgi:hypothetical protein
MADSLKEFYNNSAVTYTQLKTGVTIESNTATEEAVVKDIKVQSDFPVKFKVNNFDVLNYEPSVLGKYEGSEIIPSSSSMIAYTDQTPYYNCSVCFINQGSYEILKFKPKFSDPLGVPFYHSVESLTLTNPLLDFPDQFWFIGDDFYYIDIKGVTTQAEPLYKRTGIDVNDDVQIFTDGNSGGVAWDGVRYFFKCRAGAGTATNGLWIYDIVTGTTYNYSLAADCEDFNGCAQFDVHDGYFVFKEEGGLSLHYFTYNDTNISSSPTFRSVSIEKALQASGGQSLRIMKDLMTNEGCVFYPEETGTNDFIVLYRLNPSAIGAEPTFYKNESYNVRNMLVGNKNYMTKDIAFCQKNYNNISLNYYMYGGESGVSEIDYTRFPNDQRFTLTALDSVSDETTEVSKLQVTGVKTTA